MVKSAGEQQACSNREKAKTDGIQNGNKGWEVTDGMTQLRQPRQSGRGQVEVDWLTVYSN